ncbi:MAG: hypothetical protein GWN62_17395 [Aliifodinibius sp.]|nr:hypothetical protein [Fodinibius sp.]
MVSFFFGPHSNCGEAALVMPIMDVYAERVMDWDVNPRQGVIRTNVLIDDPLRMNIPSDR